MKTNLPKQEYELINVRRQSIETGTALTCDNCGRTILNFATIRGKQDGKTYVVGLTCVKYPCGTAQGAVSSDGLHRR